MLPRSSIATSRLTSTRLRASAREPLDSPTVTTAGMSSGVIPTAIASENSRASSSGLWNAMLKMKIVMESTPAMRTRNVENPLKPCWNADAVARSASPDAMAPNAVARPVATTTPRPAPSWTIVPMKAQEQRSTPVASGCGADDFGTGIDSPVRTASSHSNKSTSRSRMSAGTILPTSRLTTSPGTIPVVSTS